MERTLEGTLAQLSIKLNVWVEWTGKSKLRTFLLLSNALVIMLPLLKHSEKREVVIQGPFPTVENNEQFSP